MEIGKIQTRQRKNAEAIKTYSSALKYSLQNPEILRTLGLLYLAVKNN